MNDDANRTGSTEAPEDFLSAAWRRVKEHRVAQWTVGYVAVAYGIQHAVTLTSEAFQWPNAVVRVSMLLLALALPVAMTLAWYHGERASHRVSGPELTIISILLAGVAILFNAYVQPSSQRIASRPAVQEASVTAARQASLDPHGAVAVAVMPFANLSDDKQQEFFSDGMTDEVATALAKIPDLRVVARQSAYSFRNSKENSRQVGLALRATHLIEGSVYKSGNRVRITAELVKADDGLSIWSEKYDRDLTDVFTIQEDIARSIAASFHMTLGLKPGENLVSERTKDAALHDAYLQARNLVRVRGKQQLSEAITLLNSAIMRDPNYAPAWAVLANAYHYVVIATAAVVSDDASVERTRVVVEEWLAREKAAAENAIRLDGNNSDAVFALSQWTSDTHDHVASIEYAQRALMLDPDNPDALNSTSLKLAELGFLKQALAMNEHLRTVEPFVPVFRANAGRILFGAGQVDAAAEMETSAVGRLAPLPLLVALKDAAQGHYSEAADALDLLAPSFAGGAKLANMAAALLRGAPAALPAGQHTELGPLLDWVYLYRGAPDLAANMFAFEMKTGASAGGVRGLQFAPAFAAMRKTATFKRYVRDSGILTYWRAKGWPPQCHPTTGPGRAEAQSAKAGDDFECS